MERIPLSEVDEKDYNQELGRIGVMEGFWSYKIPRSRSWAFWEETRFGHVDVTVMYFYKDGSFPTRVFAGIKDDSLYAAAAVPSEGRIPPLTYTMGGAVSSSDEYGINDEHKIDTPNPQEMLSKLSDLPEETTLGDVIRLLS